MVELIRNHRNLGMYSKIYSMFAFFGFINLENIRKRYLTKLKGKILDIGVGDAGNYKYYSKDARIFVLDFEEKMLSYAKERIPKDKLKNYKFINANAQRLSKFKDNYFDAVVVVFIYCCSVPDPVLALREARRVLKDKGKLIVIAHVRSKNKILYFLQYIMEPFSKWLIGSDMTRKTKEDIKRAGFKINKEITTGGYDIFKVFIAMPNELDKTK